MILKPLLQMTMCGWQKQGRRMRKIRRNDINLFCNFRIKSKFVYKLYYPILIIYQQTQMDKKTYELMIWQQDKLIYYNDFMNKDPDYEALANSHRIQNCQGLSLSIAALVKQIHPDRMTQFKNFRTRQYQFNLFECVNGLKIILITSVRTDDDGIDNQMERIHKAYIDYVKRNYMYQHGDIIKIASFDEAITEILFPKNKSND